MPETFIKFPTGNSLALIQKVRAIEKAIAERMASGKPLTAKERKEIEKLIAAIKEFAEHLPTKVDPA